MITANIPSNYANAVSPFAPLGKLPVGEESSDNRNTPLKPVEEAAQSARAENRRGPDERAGEVEERERLRDTGRDSGQSGREASDEPTAAQNAREAPPESSQDRRSREQARRQEEEQSEIRELSTRDREVRAHEQAHASAGGHHAGAPQYVFERGPDGVSYAVSGEVSIDTSRVSGDPQATIDKARTVRRAALAPAEPSPQDRRVAALATQLELEARNELRLEERREREERQVERETQARERAEAEQAQEEARAEKESETQEDTGTAAERFEEINRLNQNLNRRLVDIGVVTDSSPSGGLLDQTV